MAPNIVVLALENNKLVIILFLLTHDLLILQYSYRNKYFTIFVCELESVAEKILEYLDKSAWVSVHLRQDVWIGIGGLIRKLTLNLDIFLLRHVGHLVDTFLDDVF